MMRSWCSNASRVACWTGLALLCARPGLALTIELSRTGPSLVGQAHEFTVTTTDAVGEVTYEWRFGDSGSFELGEAAVSHTFETTGLHSVDVAAIDEAGYTASAYFRHLVHYPLTERRPTSSSSIIYDPARDRIYSVNQDNDTITAIDATSLTVVGELTVYQQPESLALSPEGKLWVVHQDDYAIAVVDPDALVIERGFRLPYASQPVAIAMSPTGDAAYVSLMALGRVLQLNPSTGEVLGTAEVGPRPRGLAIAHDGNTLYVTRFISPDEGGEVVRVDTGSMTTSARIQLPLDVETADSDQKARGLPNYLFGVALTPDGRQAWVPGKKDNIVRGPLRDGLELTHDTTIRPLCSIIDTASGAELYEDRIDLDDRSMPMHVDFTPYGSFAFLTLAGSHRVEIRDVTRPTQVFSAIPHAGNFPRGAVLGPNHRLFVQGSLSRDVRVYDLTRLLEDFDQGTPPELAVIPTVGVEKLSADVLEGKRIFHDAEDKRMAFEGYISCGGCHFEGIDDGRVYDFSSRGEGLRNTLSLLGLGGADRGRLNWTGNMDELQDFEHQIRDLFDGIGFISDDDLAIGTRNSPLGDPKAGLSRELDALAAYVRSLVRVNPSPYRRSDGSLTAEAVAGKAVFEKLGCDFCHGGPAFSDSALGRTHDVGTLTALSGSVAGAPLFALDTPSLLGVWETPPYLHDGSAKTLRDVLTTHNPDELHGFVSVLSDAELDQLVAYVMQIDDELPVRRLPFEPPETPTASQMDDGATLEEPTPPTDESGVPEDTASPPATSGSDAPVATEPAPTGTDGGQSIVDVPAATGSSAPDSSPASSAGTEPNKRGVDGSGCGMGAQCRHTPAWCVWRLVCWARCSVARRVEDVRLPSQRRSGRCRSSSRAPTSRPGRGSPREAARVHRATRAPQSPPRRARQPMTLRRSARRQTRMNPRPLPKPKTRSAGPPCRPSPMRIRSCPRWENGSKRSSESARASATTASPTPCARAMRPRRSSVWPRSWSSSVSTKTARSL